MRSLQEIGFLCFFLLFMLPAPAMAYLSDGSDGLFNPVNSMLLDIPEDGVFNFTSIFIDSEATVTFRPIATNAPIYLLATEDIIINGTIDVSDFFNGDGGHLVFSTPGVFQLGGAILANGNPNGGHAGTITIESATMVSLEDGSYISVVGDTDVSPVTGPNSGSVTLVGSGGDITIGSTFEGPTFDGVLDGGFAIGSGEIKLNSVPVPSTIFLLASGMTGLAGLRRRQIG